MKFIPLANTDKLCLIDDEDYDRVMALRKKAEQELFGEFVYKGSI